MQQTWNGTRQFGEWKGEQVEIIDPKADQRSRRRISNRFAWSGRCSRSVMTEPKPGVYIYDFGQNLAGVERLRVSGPAGTDVQVRSGEIAESGRDDLYRQSAHREGDGSFHS